MRKETLFSILIPVYNGSKTVSGVLDSIKSQSYKNFEILLYDDCSSDTSKLIIKRWIKKNSINATLKSGKINRGSFFGLQECFKMSKGEYLVFSAQDNFFTPNRLETYNQEIKKNGNLQIISSDVFFGTHSEFIVNIGRLQKGLAGFITPNKFLLLMFRSLLFRFDSSVIRRDKFKLFPASHIYSPSEDFAFITSAFTSLVRKNKEYLHIKSPLVYVIVSRESQSHIMSHQISVASINFIKQYNCPPIYLSMIEGNIRLIGLIRGRSVKNIFNFVLSHPIQSIMGIFILGVRIIIMLMLRKNATCALNKIYYK